MGGFSFSGSKSPAEILAEQDAFLDSFNNSSTGRQYNAREASAANRAREIADFDMSMKRKELDLRVQQLKMQGKQHEAEMELKRGELELAKERLAIETEIKRYELGLNTASEYAKFASGPDMMFMKNDFVQGMNRITKGWGVQPYGTGGMPKMRTFEDFQAAMNGTWDGNNGSASAPAAAAAAQGGGGAGVAQDGGPDPRVKAVDAVLKAIPPSDTAGADENDEAAMQAVFNIIKAKRPATMQKMRPGQREAFAAGASKAGMWAPDVIADLERAGIGQGNNRAY